MVSPMAPQGVVQSRTNVSDVTNAATPAPAPAAPPAPALNPAGFQDEFVAAAAPDRSKPVLAGDGTSEAGALEKATGGGKSKRKEPAPVQIARSVVNQAPEGEPGPWATDVATSDTPVGQAMTDGIPGNVNCANFVSAVLEVAGWIEPEQHRDNTGLAPGVDDGLYDVLKADEDWQEVDTGESVGPEDFKPGDVVFIYSPDGPVDHVLICTGKDEHGQPTFVSANNVDSNFQPYAEDRSQRVTEKTYPPELWGQLDQVHIMRHP